MNFFHLRKYSKHESTFGHLATRIRVNRMQIRNIGMRMLVHLVHTVQCTHVQYNTLCVYVRCTLLSTHEFLSMVFLPVEVERWSVARKGMLCRFFFFFILSVAFVTQSISFFLSLFSYILQPKSPPPTLLENISDDA